MEDGKAGLETKRTMDLGVFPVYYWNTPELCLNGHAKSEWVDKSPQKIKHCHKKHTIICPVTSFIFATFPSFKYLPVTLSIPETPE